MWTAGSGNTQLLFIFPTRVSLTAISLHYYSDSTRGLPKLRFWAVPDDFDVWDAPPTNYTYVEVAEVSAGGEQGHRNETITFNIPIIITKILLVKFRSSLSFALSEVEFFRSICSSQPVSISMLKDLTKASVYLTTLYATSASTTELESRKTSEFKFELL